ncbi:MAG TPA: sensor domain-containing phosphodiesterase [Actinocrinis sp.]
MIRSAHPAWLSLVLALLFGFAGALALTATDHRPGDQDELAASFGSVAAVFHALRCVAAGVALVLLTRLVVRRRIAADLLDVLIIASGLAMLAWSFRLLPNYSTHEIGGAARVEAIVFPLADAALCAIAVRFIATEAVKLRAAWMLIVGAFGLFVSDVYFSVMLLHPGLSASLLGNIGYACCYGLWGAAALEPDMAWLGSHRSGAGEAHPHAWTATLIAASLMGPLAVVIQAERHGLRRVSVMAVFCALLFLLVVARLSLAMRERLALDEALRQRENEAYFKALVANAADVIMVIDADGRIRYASPSAGTLLSGADLTGQPLGSLVDEQQAARLRLAMARLGGAAVGGASGAGGSSGAAEPSHSARPTRPTRPGHVDGGHGRGGRDSVERIVRWNVLHASHDWPMQLKLVTADGRTVEVEGRCDDLRGDPAVRGFVLTLRDVTEQRRLERELWHLAFHDPLTGLANRRRLRDRLDEALEVVFARGDILGVALLDLDDFKEVNDRFGHAVGDELIDAIAWRLSANVRNGDLVARLGGDEFALVLGPARGVVELEETADRIVGLFDIPFEASVGELHTSVSLGLATTADDDCPDRPGEARLDAEELLQHADLALYSVKVSGKRGMRRYEPALRKAAVERAELRSELDVTLESDGFTLEYQPIVRLADRAVVAAEALVRWPHPLRGAVPPEQFIALAEQTGQILPLGRWILRHAVADAAGWAAGRPEPGLAVNVNVSALQLRDPGFALEVRRSLSDSGLRASMLVIEVTESALAEHADGQVAATLAQLKALGVTLALDDFGTGYSSLAYLRDFPLDALKIDKSFVDRMRESAHMATLVEAIAGIASTLGLHAVAEGVETEQQAAELRDLGCGFGQGYLFGSPMSAGMLTELADAEPGSTPGAGSEDE